MTLSNARTQLNQKLDQLPPGILKVVTEFVDFLLYRHSQASESSKNIVLEKDSSTETHKEFKDRSQQIDDKNIRRAQGSLLDNTETWVGDDFEECLQSVYDTRSQIRA